MEGTHQRLEEVYVSMMSMNLLDRCARCSIRLSVALNTVVPAQGRYTSRSLCNYCWDELRDREAGAFAFSAP